MKGKSLLTNLLIAGIGVSTLFMVYTAANQILNWDRFMKKFSETYSGQMPEEAGMARDYISNFFTKDFEALKSRMAPGLLEELNQADLESTADRFFSQQPIHVDIVGSNTLRRRDSWRGSFTFQYQFPDRWLLVGVSTEKKGENQDAVLGITIQPLRDSLQNIHRFTFADKGAKHYLFLAIAIATPLLIICALTLCAFADIPKKKWLWILFISFGFVQLTLDWTTGAIRCSPIHMSLLGSGYSLTSPYAAVVLNVTFPLGAILFLYKRLRFLYKRLRFGFGSVESDPPKSDSAVFTAPGPVAATSPCDPMVRDNAQDTEQQAFPDAEQMYVCDQCEFTSKRETFHASELFCPDCGSRLE